MDRCRTVERRYGSRDEDVCLDRATPARLLAVHCNETEQVTVLGGLPKSGSGPTLRSTRCRRRPNGRWRASASSCWHQPQFPPVLSSWSRTEHAIGSWTWTAARWCSLPVAGGPDWGAESAYRGVRARTPCLVIRNARLDPGLGHGRSERVFHCRTGISSMIHYGGKNDILRAAERPRPATAWISISLSLGPSAMPSTCGRCSTTRTQRPRQATPGASRGGSGWSSSSRGNDMRGWEERRAVMRRRGHVVSLGDEFSPNVGRENSPVFACRLPGQAPGGRAAESPMLLPWREGATRWSDLGNSS